MKLTLKTVKGTQFSLEVEENAKVSDVKAKVESEQGENFPADKMMLIFKGKVLKDDTTLAENSITENGFMVVMITKENKPAPSPPAPAPTSAPPPTSESAPAAPVPAPSASPAAAPASNPEPAAAAAVATGDSPANYSSAASTLAVGADLENSIKMICEMGFEREQVVRAMRAAYNNPDRAVEFLMTGIPEMQAEEAPQAAAANPAAQPQEAPGGAPAGGPNSQPLDMFPQGMPGSGGGRVGSGSLDFLRSNAQFNALRQMVQANPQILQPMLQELGKQNPQLLQLINSNQEEFLQLINEPPPEGTPSLDSLAAMAGGEEGAEGGPPTIAITPEDQEAIGRLEAMGFDRAICIEAYFACEKNEEHAANFLLENPDMMGDD